MEVNNGYTTRLNELLDRWNAGDESAMNEIVIHAQGRLERMASRMLSNKPHVSRWNETGDVLQNSLVRLCRALKEVRPDNKLAFHGLAAQQIRRELCDLARSLYGPLGHGRHHKTEAPAKGIDEVQGLQYEAVAQKTDSINRYEMAAFHESVEKLDEAQREVFDLIFYQGMTQTEVAALIGVSDRTVKRRFRDAKLSLNEMLEDNELKGNPAS